MSVRIAASTLTKAAEKAGVPDLFDVSRPGDGTTQYVMSNTHDTYSSKSKRDMSFLVGLIAGHAHDGTSDVGDKIDAGLFREADKRNPNEFANGFQLGYFQHHGVA
jgi:hypothetical protein